MKSILDPTFRYVPAAKTDIRATIRREQRRLKAEAEKAALNQQEATSKVRPLTKKARS